MCLSNGSSEPRLGYGRLRFTVCICRGLLDQPSRVVAGRLRSFTLMSLEFKLRRLMNVVGGQSALRHHAGQGTGVLCSE